MKKVLRRFSALALALVMAIGLSVQAFAADFSDVPSSHWAHESISELTMRGVLNGVGGGLFDPNGTVTSAQFAAMFTRLFYRAAIDFSKETYTHWWGVNIQIASKNDLLKGTTVASKNANAASADSWTDVDQPMSRNDMAMVMYNYLVMVKRNPMAEETEAAKAKISDFSTIPASYQDAVAAVYAAGYLKGYDSTGKFAGSETMTRAQAAEVLWRLYKPLIVEPAE